MRGSMILILATLANAAVAQDVSHPVAGSSERGAILDAIRPLVEAELGAPVAFEVTTLNVAGDWAFVAVVPQRPGGAPIPPDDDDGTDDGHAESVLRRVDGRWTPQETVVGATDVWYLGWCDRVPTGLIAARC